MGHILFVCLFTIPSCAQDLCGSAFGNYSWRGLGEHIGCLGLNPGLRLSMCKASTLRHILPPTLTLSYFHFLSSATFFLQNHKILVEGQKRTPFFSRVFFGYLYVCVCFRSYQSVLKAYPWFFAQGSPLKKLRGPYGVPRIKFIVCFKASALPALLSLTPKVKVLTSVPGR